ncbi:hypothetical protein F511_06555 [Dorcoceras hygrometricum]|uniref:Uncharacterized protein n=1 Tax=Dorcoceras hygrometricum TaxID=472368 RepID=A0A2Z7AJ53_9LAMI|nr:hypothetical protein F511_06555 [Dorcoceras hygrometricum]
MHAQPNSRVLALNQNAIVLTNPNDDVLEPATENTLIAATTGSDHPLLNSTLNQFRWLLQAHRLTTVRPVSSLEKKPASPKHKLIVEEDSDSEDAEPLKKMIKASAKPTLDILMSLLDDVLPPFLTTVEPVTKLGADSRLVRLELPTAKATTASQIMSQQPFIDTIAPICFFILPCQDSALRRPYPAVFQQQWGKVSSVGRKGDSSNMKGSENWYRELSHSSGTNSWIENTDYVHLKVFLKHHAISTRQIVPKLDKHGVALRAGPDRARSDM